MIIGTVVLIAGRPIDGSMVILADLAMIEEVSQGMMSAPGGVGALLVVLGVIRQVAPLAIGAKVRRVAVLRRVVEVGDGQYDARDLVAGLFPVPSGLVAFRPGVGAVITPSSVRNSALLAGVPGAVQNACANLPPVGGVAGAMFGFDRHVWTPGRPWPLTGG